MESVVVVMQYGVCCVCCQPLRTLYVSTFTDTDLSQSLFLTHSPSCSLLISGKSTLLKLICCENAPTEGTVSTRSGALYRLYRNAPYLLSCRSNTHRKVLFKFSIQSSFYSSHYVPYSNPLPLIPSPSPPLPLRPVCRSFPPALSGGAGPGDESCRLHPVQVPGQVPHKQTRR